MSARDHGGPAFPVTPPCDMEGASASGYPFPAEGMTLRDYFAAKALQGMLADMPKTLYGISWIAGVSKTAYELADAMLKARAA